MTSDADHQGRTVLPAAQHAVTIAQHHDPHLESKEATQHAATAAQHTFNGIEPAQQGSRVSSAAQGRERSEAARRGARNSLLLSLHRVAVTELAEYQDLPLAASRHLLQFLIYLACIVPDTVSHIPER